MSILKVGRPSIAKAKAIEQINEKEGSIKMNLNVTKSFHKEIKLFALEHDMTVTHLIHKALYEFMKK